MDVLEGAAATGRVRRGRHEEVDVVVVGGGLAGLAAANAAALGGAGVVLLDGRRPGGRAGTTRSEHGAVFNSGPRALYRQGAGLRVLRSLGVEPEGGRAPRSGHALADGEVHRLPSNPALLVASRLLSPRSKLRVGALLARLPRLDTSEHDAISLRQLFAARGLDDDAIRLLRGVVRIATYVDDVDSFSAGAALAQVQMALSEGVLYLHGGWQQLVDGLAERAAQRHVVVRRDAVQAVEPLPSSSADPRARWAVRTPAGEVVAGSVVVASGSPESAASLLPMPLGRGGLGAPATAACLELAVRRRPPVTFLAGLDEPLYLSVHSLAAQLAPPGIEVVHVMRYGARDSASDRSDLWRHATAAGIRGEDVVDERFLHRMVVTGGIPTAAGGGLGGRPGVEVPGASGVFLAGDWVGDEGMLADAALSSGARAGTAAAAVAHSARAAAGTTAAAARSATSATEATAATTAAAAPPATSATIAAAPEAAVSTRAAGGLDVRRGGPADPSATAARSGWTESSLLSG